MYLGLTFLESPCVIHAWYTVGENSILHDLFDFLLGSNRLLSVNKSINSK